MRVKRSSSFPWLRLAWQGANKIIVCREGPVSIPQFAMPPTEDVGRSRAGLPLTSPPNLSGVYCMPPRNSPNADVTRPHSWGRGVVRHCNRVCRIHRRPGAGT